MKKLTDQELFDTAKKHNTKKSFYTNDRRTYYVALTRGKSFYQKCTEHMVNLPNPFNTDMGMIYGFFFEDNSVYIGSTIQPKIRKKEHLRRGKIFDKIQTGSRYHHQELENFIVNEHLLAREQFFIDHFTVMGCKMLNSHHATSRGGICNKWSKTKLVEESQKYKTVGDWIKNSPSSYSIVCQRGLKDLLTKHMICLHKRRTDEDIIADAKKYNTKVEWQRKSSAIYRVALRRKIIDICCAHMKVLLRTWTEDEIIEEAKKHKTTRDWVHHSPTSYNQARHRGLLNKCRSGYTVLNREWTDDELITEAMKYKSFSE
jgi:hypothetical protein